MHGAEHETYVAEKNLQACDLEAPIDNPALGLYFKGFESGRYILNKSLTN
ncbi:hypothetical protein imdm_1382 [gamma proteobacterium IMCC2047]|nr:hypothetical protein imdm_1382 [gamma proteobacterium IMCC2047]